jgi:2-polyprenyl-3-methyl-5-hydroxy-6-metoxy-1,4-benzoquinol methylase
MVEEKYAYQYGFSETFGQYMYDEQLQRQKALKVLAVLEDFCGGHGSLNNKSLLDIGCSAGLMTKLYSVEFDQTVGIDIDGPAVEYASSHFSADNVKFLVRDAMNTALQSESFDVVICSHIYEHVPDFNGLMDEVYRVLRKGGICYFAAHNRICLIEPHYRLPLLSVIPKPLSHIYYRLSGKGEHYYENLLTLRRLRKLVSKFETYDYTLKIINDPEKFHAEELMSPHSLKQKMALLVLRIAYFACPTYLWILKKQQ